MFTFFVVVFIVCVVLLALIFAFDKNSRVNSAEKAAEKYKSTTAGKEKIETLHGIYLSYMDAYNKNFGFRYFKEKDVLVSDGEIKKEALITADKELFVYEYCAPKPEKIWAKQKNTGRYVIDRVDAPTRGYFKPVIKEKLDNILYYIEEGNLQYTTAVGGGGVDVAGAIKGGLIAGTAGAIVGGRQAVYTQTVEHDNRKLFLVKKTGEKIEFNYKEFYPAFSKIMPEKDYAFVSMNK